jgi:hypothetical protein
MKPGLLLIPALVAAGVAGAFFASDPWRMATADAPAAAKPRHADPPPGEIRAEAVFSHPTGYR